ncbi:MAG: CpaF family protein [Anaerolineales bacterium]
MNDLDKLKAYLIQKVQERLTRTPLVEGTFEQQQAIMRQWLQELYAQTRLTLSPEVAAGLFDDVLDSLVGYGPLQVLLSDPEVSEIMVYGAKQVYVEKHGQLVDVPFTFENNQEVYRIIDRIIRPLGLRVDRQHPTVDARLPDGSRVNIVVPPVAVDGPTITIRKFLPSKLTVEDLLALGSLTPHMAEFLQACVVARINLIITGNTSSGKTTLLNVLSDYIPHSERIITIEDAAELRLKQKYVVRLETRPGTPENGQAVLARDLVRNALRMRPDRIIVGEVRSGEAIDMLQAMNTGHMGSLTTLHANSPRDAIARLETMAMMAGLDMPLIAIRRQIASAIDLIVHMARLEDGTRKITHITEVAGMEGDIVTLSDIFRFQRTGVDSNGRVLGDLAATRLRPLFAPKLEAAGVKLGSEIFGAGVL